MQIGDYHNVFFLDLLKEILIIYISFKENIKKYVLEQIIFFEELVFHLL